MAVGCRDYHRARVVAEDERARAFGIDIDAIIGSLGCYGEAVAGAPGICSLA